MVWKASEKSLLFHQCGSSITTSAANIYNRHMDWKINLFYKGNFKFVSAATAYNRNHSFPVTVPNRHAMYLAKTHVVRWSGIPLSQRGRDHPLYTGVAPGWACPLRWKLRGETGSIKGRASCSAGKEPGKKADISLFAAGHQLCYRVRQCPDPGED